MNLNVVIKRGLSFIFSLISLIFCNLLKGNDEYIHDVLFTKDDLMVETRVTYSYKANTIRFIFYSKYHAEREREVRNKYTGSVKYLFFENAYKINYYS